MMSTLTGLSMIAALGLLYWLYWRQRLSPVMLVVLALAWLTGNIEMLLTELNDRLPDGLAFIAIENLDYATRLYNCGFMALAVGMRAGTRHMDVISALASQGVQGRWLQRAQGLNALRLYGVLFLLTFPLELLMYGPLRGLMQLLLPFMALRFFPISVLAHDYFRNGRHGVLLLGVCIFEIVINLSFFSSFQALFVVIACAMMMALMTGGYRKWLMTSVAVLAMFSVFAVWSYMKPDFRAYLTGGELTQNDTRSTTEKVDFALNQLRAMTAEDFQDGMSQSLARLAYNGYFAATTYNVPTYRPFTNGQSLLDSLRYAFMPRILFPDKPIIDDSIIATKLTGIQITGMDRGTSINVGLFGELYADLGVPWMFLALGLAGFLMARMEGFIFRHIGPGQEALAFSALFIGAFGTGVYSLPKFVGAMIYLFAAMFVFFSYFYHQMKKA